MSVTYPIYVYGNADVYREVFNAIATTMGTSGYHVLITLSIAIAGTFAIVNYSVSRNMLSLAKFLGLYYLAFYIIFIPRVTVNIIDEFMQGAGPSYSVDHVPQGLAFVAHYTTLIGVGLTQLIEKTFTLPADANYSKTGMVMASRLAQASTHFQITDPNFAKSLQSFVGQCVYYDLLLEKYSWSELVNAPDLWGFVSQRASPARSFVYTTNGETEIKTCKAGVVQLTHDWETAREDAAAHYGLYFFPGVTNPNHMLLSYLPNTYQLLSGVSTTGQSLLTQTLMMNALQSGVLAWGAQTNSLTAMEAYSFTKAQSNQRQSNSTGAALAAYWLPLIQNSLEALLMASFVFVFLFILYSGLKVVKFYVLTMLWLQLWAPLYAILNLFMTLQATRISTGIIGNTGLTLMNQAGFAQANADFGNLAGYLSMAVPVIAYSLIKLETSMFHHVAQYIGGAMQNAATSAASETSAGNVSLGNINYSTHSAMNTSANHFATNARLSSGMLSQQLPGGSTLSVSPNGTSIMNNQGALSNLGVSANLSDSLRASFTKQAEHAETAAFTQAQAYANSTASGLRQVNELSKHLGTSSASGDSWAVSTNTQVAQAVGELKRTTERFAHDHHLSLDEASSVLGAAYAGASVGTDSNRSLVGKAIGAVTGVSGNASVGTRRESSNVDSTRTGSVYTAAEDTVRDSHFARNMDLVERSVHDHSFRANTEDGARLVHSMGSSLDSARSARDEMSANLQQAETYRENASLSEDIAVNINANPSQIVYSHLEKQGYTAAVIEQVMTLQPEHAEVLVKEAVRNYTDHVAKDWSHELPHSSASINETYHANQTRVHSEPDVQHDYKHHNAAVTEQAATYGLNESLAMDQSAKRVAEHAIHENHRKIDTASTVLSHKDAQVEKQIREAQRKKSQHSSYKNFVSGLDESDNR